ncbi:MAG: hypothetical protein PHO70_08290 [Candidatus Omnitrophica bacterium]|nr:hypothetical protein [Candidatus Omnitrophota bacterium]
MRRKLVSGFLVVCFAVIFSGCSGLKEDIKCVMGISTKELEKGRSNAVKKTFNYDFDTCFNKTREILIKKGSYIYAQDKAKKMIAVYLSAASYSADANSDSISTPSGDTTEVGFFFTNIDANNTQIEVTSPSTYAKDTLSGKVFLALEESLIEQKEKLSKVNEKKPQIDQQTAPVKEEPVVSQQQPKVENVILSVQTKPVEQSQTQGATNEKKQ